MLILGTSHYNQHSVLMKNSTATRPLPAGMSPEAAAAIVWTACIAGTLDIAAAVINYLLGGGKTPVKIFQFIASGIFGKKAFSDGLWMPVLGFIFHYLIAFAWTFLFFMLYGPIRTQLKNAIATGLVYGLFIWLIMNQVVLPLSATPKMPFNIVQAVISALILMFMVGLPVSILADKYYAAKTNGE
jgi:hypothetical protein